MDMMTVEVLMFHNDVGHFGKPHLLHILMCNLNILCFAEPVVGMRVQRNVHHCLFGFGSLRHPAFEILEDTVDVYLPAAVIVDFVCVEHPSMLLIDLLSVVDQTSVKRIS